MIHSILEQLIRRIYHVGLAASWLVIASVLLLKGLDYYLVPIAERPFAEGHGIYDPTGRMGNRLGIAGAAMMGSGVLLYSTRKRWPRLHRVGRLRDWLSFHIFLCTLGPFLVVLHTSFRVRGLVAIAFWAMIVVVASGLIGRYVYVRIPRALNGNARTRDEIEQEQRAVFAQIQQQAGAHAARLERWFTQAPAGEGGSLQGALTFGWRTRGERTALQRALAELPIDAAIRAELSRNVERHRRLARDRMLLEPFQRVFRYWHAFHLPLALVMLLVLAVHIGVAIAFGYGWTP